MQPATSHPGIYINTNGQPSTLPEMEGLVGPHLGIRSPDLSLIGDYSRGEEQSSSGKSSKATGRCLDCPPAKRGCCTRIVVFEGDLRVHLVQRSPTFVA